MDVRTHGAMDSYTAQAGRGTVGDASYGDSEESKFSNDIAAIWAAAYRSRFWIIGIVVGSLLFGVIVTILSTPIYRADATVQIDQEAAKVLGTEDTNASAAIQDSDRFLKTQLDVIRSRALARTVAEDLKLFNNAEFLESMNVDPDAASTSSLPPQDAQRELVLETLDQNLSVSLPPDSRIATISFDSPSPDLAARVANSFSQNYIRNNLQRKFDTSSYAREFLKQQLDEAAVRLADSEREALEYARRTRIIDASNAANPSGDQAGAPKSLVAATLVKLNENYATALSRRIEAQQRWENAQNQDPMSLPQVLNNLAIQNLLQQKAMVQAEYEEELQRRKADFPTVKQAKARLDELNQQVTAIASSIRQAIKGDYQTALQQEKALERQLSDLKSDTLNEQGQAVQLGILQRKTTNDRRLYDLLLSRYNELNAEAGVQANNVSIVDGASRPAEPIKPSIPLNLALSLLAGVALASLFVFGREQLFNIVRTPDDVVRKLGFPSLGVIPKMQEGNPIEQAILDPKTHASETFASLRSSLMLVSSHGLPQSMMFTSSRQGEGKSSCCFATAVALSRIGKKVLIVDLDLRRPQQHRFFGVKNTEGMSDLLTHNKSASEVILKTQYDGIDFIPSGSIPPNPAELLANPASSQILGELQKSYDTILIDSPPTLGLADAIEISVMVEACVFVLEAANNRTGHVRSSIDRLLGGGANIIGVLLTKFDLKEAGYSADYTYQYTYNYSE